MGNFFKLLAIAAVGFVMASCAKGQLSLGNLSSSSVEEYAIVQAGYDESFEMARRALQETGLEIVQSEKNQGLMVVQVPGESQPFQDARTITSRPAEFEYSLQQLNPDHLAFTVKSNASSQEGADQFLQAYGKYIEFVETKESRGAAKLRSSATRKESSHEQVITETREIGTQSPSIPEVKFEFTRQEIIEIQTFLYRLGYDPGPADGSMNKKTIDAIERFIKEYRFIGELFQPSGPLQ